MEDVFKIGMLLDFYGQLLTKKQYEVMDLHYNGDYSLSEIAEHLNISRQGVHDNVKRGRSLLGSYEKKLGLLKRFMEQKSKMEKMLKHLKGIDISGMKYEDRQKLSGVIDDIEELIERL